MAMKATSAVIKGERVSLYKEPKTDSGKNSAKGLLHIGLDNQGEYVLTDDVSEEREASSSNCLEIISIDGEFVQETSWSDVKEELNA